jgi:integrase
MLPVDNARQGFVEPETFEKIAANLPADLADAARFAYSVGWRKGQVSKLRWEHVDRTNRLMIVPGKLTKNRKPQTIALEGELWTIIERRWLRREVRRKRRPVFLSPVVFHRGDGKPIGDFRKKWAKACVMAKVSGLLFHDLRRSGVRNLIRAGVDRDVAKKISGHKTDSMFSRYNITDERDQRVALIALDHYVATRKNSV